MVDSPLTPSGDRAAMSDYLAMVRAILGGAETMRAAGTHNDYMSGPVAPVGQLNQLTKTANGTFVQKNIVAQSPYLPAFPNEGAIDYECRRKHAPFTNLYADISDNLSAKPFSKELELDEGEPDDLKVLSENIDGQGNNLHVFARNTFKNGLDNGVEWILVDYTSVPTGATLAAERAINARPYWVAIPADRMLAVYSVFLNGQEQICHARIHEPVSRQDGYGETQVDRVRVLSREQVVDDVGNTIALGPPVWELFERVTNDDKSDDWITVGQGSYTIGVIPLVPFLPAGRDGMSWRVKFPLSDIAYLQVEEFQQESNLKTIKELTAFPMVSGNGVTLEEGQVVPVGPRAVLTAPMGADGTHGEWTFIEPTAASLTFLQSDLEKLREEMRNLGRQPLASANLTVVTTANVSMKAHNAVQAWALMLKDALEQAWKITCLWLRQDREPVVNVHTDFGVELEAGTELDALLKAEAQAVLSKRTVQDEFKRRGVLSDDFDPDEEEQRLAEEQQGLQPEQQIDPRTGNPIAVQAVKPMAAAPA